MNGEIKKIREIAAESAKSLGLFLIDCNVRGTKSYPVIEVFIDGVENVSTEECEKVSNRMKKIFDNEVLFNFYRLDVSSPGVDRALIYIEQYHKHINRMFQLEYKSGEVAQKMHAKLIRIEENILTFLTDKEIKLRFQDIVKAKVLVSFNQRR